MNPPRYLLAVNPFFALALCMLIAAGCNAFEFMHEAGDTNDPYVLLGDARLAMQNGDAAQAATLLEKALAKAPENQEIKIELASALFQANHIDLHLMKDLADFIADRESSNISKIQPASINNCSFDASFSSHRKLKFDEVDAYTQLLNNTETLERTLNLLSESLDGQDLSTYFIGNAYLMRAIAAMGTSIVKIKARADSLNASLYQHPQGYIGYCAPTQAAREEIETYVLCEKLPVVNAAIDDLLYRQSLLGIADSELVETVSRARDELANPTSLSCGGFYPANVPTNES